MWILGLKGLTETWRGWQQKEGTLRFQDVDVDHEDEVNERFYSHILKTIDTAENFILLFFLFYQKIEHGIVTAQVFSDHLACVAGGYVW